MFTDLLHQLFKNVIKFHLMKWIDVVIKKKLQTRKRRKDQNRRTIRALMNCSATIWINQVYRRISVFTKLKKFKHYSEIDQWQDLKYKDLLRQLLFAVTFLIDFKNLNVMLCIKVIVNFVIIAQYFFYIEDTMNYMTHYLNIIDKTKESFWRYDSKVNFRFFKLHSLIHYIKYIKKFENLFVLSFDASEIAHKNHFKEFFNRTNKCSNYEKQLFRINTRRMNLLTIVELNIYERETSFTSIDDRETVYVNKVSRVKSFDDIDWTRSQIEWNELQSMRCNSRNWCFALIGNRYNDIFNLVKTLTMFVRQQRVMIQKKSYDRDLNNKREVDYSWIKRYLIQIHESIRTWKKLEKNSMNVKQLTKKFCRCIFNWQNMNKRRCDHVWI